MMVWLPLKVETAAQKKMFHGADYVFMADM